MSGGMDVHFDFSINDRVNIDGDTSIRATITSILITGEGAARVQYECVWMHNGSHASAYIDDGRLTPCS
jgi:hypothetical protein